MPRAERHQLGDGEARRRNHPARPASGGAKVEGNLAPAHRAVWPRGVALAVIGLSRRCVRASMSVGPVVTEVPVDGGSRHRLTGVLTGARPPVAK